MQRHNWDIQKAVDAFTANDDGDDEPIFTHSAISSMGYGDVRKADDHKIDVLMPGFGDRIPYMPPPSRVKNQEFDSTLSHISENCKYIREEPS